MTRHNGMRPQDIVVLLKMIALNGTPWKLAEMANALSISQSEISGALDRSLVAGLIDETKRKVHRKSLLEFLIYGLKYVFPEQPGALVKGMPTAHSAEPLRRAIKSEEDVYVWPDPDGEVRGQAITPLYSSVPRAARADKHLYELLALADAIRVGKTREYQLAAQELRKRLET